MRIVHTVGSLSIHAGGPSFTVPRLCEHLQDLGTQNRVCIVTKSGDAAAPNRSVRGVTVHEVSDGRYLQNLNSISATNGTQQPLLIHDHGQWISLNRASATFARRSKTPRIVSPRGMLSPWARAHRKYKKLLAWWMYARRDLDNARLIHATSDLEANELRNLGVTAPIAVIPNGVDMAELDLHARPKPARPYVLFLSRIHRKKGIQELLRVWQSLQPTNWDLVFAGFDEEGLLTGQALPPNTRYVGHLEGPPKDDLLQRANLFILPSHSENFGVVVAEALMAGVPVITTHGTPWESLQTERCGWWVPMEEPALRQSLVDAMSLPPAELDSMGQRGRDFAIRSFGWGKIAEQMLASYRWILEGGQSPPWIQQQ